MEGELEGELELELELELEVDCRRGPGKDGMRNLGKTRGRRVASLDIISERIWCRFRFSFLGLRRGFEVKVQLVGG